MQEPKFTLGERVIPTVDVDRQEYPDGYTIGLIEWRNYEWIYWQTFNTGDITLGCGFAEQHLEAVQ